MQSSSKPRNRKVKGRITLGAAAIAFVLCLYLLMGGDLASAITMLLVAVGAGLFAASYLVRERLKAKTVKSLEYAGAGFFAVAVVIELAEIFL